MSRKSLVYLGLFIGSAIGSFIPSLFGSNALSMPGLFTSAIGALIGICVGYKLSE